MTGAGTGRAGRGLDGGAGLHTLLEALPHGLVLIGPEGGIVLCTPRARDLLGFGPDAAISARLLVRRLADRRLGEEAVGLRAALRAGSTGSFTLAVGQTCIEVGLSPAPGGGWSVTVQDATARRAAEADAAQAARVDPLTGLANRLLFRERLAEALREAGRGGEPRAVLLIDLDRFKQVNDTLGHPVGDALLRNVAGRLRSALSPADTLARLGGDEFVILQGPGGAAEAEALARRVVDLVGRSYMVEGHLVSIGASVGVALAPTDGDVPERILKSADLALYRAKADGRGTFRFFEAGMDARVQARRLMELDLRRAMVMREFELHYQPQLNLETNTLLGCEALLRWRHRERGLVSPLDFIPLAEEIGLIVPIGEWVLRTAAKEAARWPDHVAIAVNVSPAQFKSRRLVEAVAAALQSSGLPAHRLELEITEGVLLQETEATLDTLHRLKALGLRISMDDFGTGYSSLSYLRAFPFDKIKIDRSFVRDLSVKPEGEALIRAIAGLGRSLGMATVAEGVETADQMRRIHAEGCTDVQGYLISKPVPAADILTLLSSSGRRAA